MTFRETCAEVKARVKIEQVANLFLKLTPENGTYRANCVCGQGGDRAMIITPAKGVFHCFSCKASGSVIALVMLCKSCTAQEAVEWLKEDPPEPKPNGFDYIKYRDSLDTEHELLQKTGLSKEMCIAFGIGVKRGKVQVPLFDHHGNFQVYATASDLKLPKNWERK